MFPQHSVQQPAVSHVVAVASKSQATVVGFEVPGLSADETRSLSTTGTKRLGRLLNALNEDTHGSSVYRQGYDRQLYGEKGSSYTPLQPVLVFVGRFSAFPVHWRRTKFYYRARVQLSRAMQAGKKAGEAWLKKVFQGRQAQVERLWRLDT